MQEVLDPNASFLNWIIVVTVVAAIHIFINTMMK